MLEERTLRELGHQEPEEFRFARQHGVDLEAMYQSDDKAERKTATKLFELVQDILRGRVRR